MGHNEIRAQSIAPLQRENDQEMVEEVEPALRKALEGKPSLEVRRHVEELLAKPVGPVTRAEKLRGLRAVAVLEHIGSAGARHVLEGLAGPFKSGRGGQGGAQR